MKLSRKGAAFIRLHEGFRSRWYKDATGTGTIGIGFTWLSSSFRDWWRLNKPGVLFGPGVAMSEAEAEEALIFLVEREYGKAVNAFLKKDVPQHVFDAMCSAVFNLGPGALKWKWAAAAKDGDYAAAAARLRNTGTTSKGKQLAGLVRRRREEALLLEKGVYTGVAAEPVAPQPEPSPTPQAPSVPPRQNFLAALLDLILNLFRKD